MARKQVTDRRTFLTDAGAYGALLAGTTLPLGSRALAAQDDVVDAANARVVKEKTMLLRIFGLVQRAPGFTKTETRVKSPQGYWGYARDVYFQATKKVHGQALQHIHNVILDSGYGDVGQSTCTALSNRDFVAEFSMLANPPARPPRPAGQGGTDDAAAATPTAPRRGFALPDFIEQGTDLSVVTRQVIAEGTRPPGVVGRERAMHFIKLSPNVPAADQVKVWQALHDKAIQATPAFAKGVAGQELLQRLPDLAPRQPSRCGTEMPVADLVACFWSKTSQAAGEFPNYVRALRKADQQKEMDGPASFFVLVEEWEAMTQPTFEG